MEALQQEQQIKTPQQWTLENLKGLFPDVNKTTIENAISILPKFAYRLPVEVFPSFPPKKMTLILRNKDQLVKNTIVISDSNANGRIIAPKQFILIIQLQGEVQNVKYPHIELFTKMNKRQIKALTMKTVGYIPPRWTFPASMHAS